MRAGPRAAGRVLMPAWCAAVSLGWGILALGGVDGEPDRGLSSDAVPVTGAMPSALPVAYAPAPEVAALSRDIARRFKVSETEASTITRQAFAAAREHGVEPMLVLAVVAVESGYQSDAVNPASGAMGLMQVLAKWHPEKIQRIGGESQLLSITPNLDVGTAILAEYLRRERGDVDGALRRYSGSLTAQYYSERVLQQQLHFSKVVEALG
jgi:soluble lytic murein transglycosylase-like protein